MDWKKSLPLMVLLPIIVLGVGYALRTEPQVIAQRSDEQVAIQLYSDQAQALEPTVLTFKNSWEAANKEKTTEGFVHAVETRTLPALRTLSDELQRVKCGTPELREIHQKLVLGYEAVIPPLQTMTETTKDSTVERLHQEVVQQLVQLIKTNSAYRAEIQTYYTQHQVAPASEMNPGSASPGKPVETGQNHATEDAQPPAKAQEEATP